MRRKKKKEEAEQLFGCVKETEVTEDLFIAHWHGPGVVKSLVLMNLYTSNDRDCGY